MIVTDCPALEDILNYEIDENGNYRIIGVDTSDYCVKYKRLCKEENNCLIKQMVKGNKIKFEVKNDI